MVIELAGPGRMRTETVGGTRPCLKKRLVREVDRVLSCPIGSGDGGSQAIDRLGGKKFLAVERSVSLSSGSYKAARDRTRLPVLHCAIQLTAET